MTLSAEGQPKIRPEHLDRAAYVYVRQSSLYQVEHHREGRLRQYDLVAWAQEVGWAKERIVVLDEDQGKSSAIPQTRAGFGDLIARVGRGEVGMVISLEVERLARNNVDWHHLVYLPVDGYAHRRRAHRLRSAAECGPDGLGDSGADE